MMLSRTPPRRRRELWSGRARRGLRWEASSSFITPQKVSIKPSLPKFQTVSLCRSRARRSRPLLPNRQNARERSESFLVDIVVSRHIALDGRRLSRRRRAGHAGDRRSRTSRPVMASMLIGSAVGAASAARVTAVRPRAGAGARAFAFGANHAASPSRVASLGRRGTVRVAVRASLSLETVREEKPEARVVSEDAHASASRGEALKQVQTRPSNRLPPWRKISPTWSAFALFEVCRASTLTVRHPRLPSFHAVRTTRRARRRCHGLRAGFPLCVSAPAATPSAPRSNLQLARSFERVFARRANRRRNLFARRFRNHQS